MIKSFEDYLKEVHGKNYHGTDDDMPDDYELWLSELGVDELIEYANEAIKIIHQSYENNQH